MSIDLERSLAQLAASVHDDATTARMSGQVHHMVSRIRRRRAARQASTGVVSVGAVAAVAFGGIQLAGRDGGTGPAPTIAPADDTSTQCGAVVTDPNAGADPRVALVVAVGAVDTDGPVTSLPVSVSYSGELEGMDAAQDDPAVVVARDGIVVGVPAALDGVRLSAPPSYSYDQPLTSCEPGQAGALLPPGDYEVVALQTVTVGDAELEVFGSAPLTITEAPEVSEEPTADPESTSSEAALADLLASPTGTFPACGSSIDTMDDGLHPITLAMTLPSDTFAAGEAISTSVDLRPGELTEYVIGNASPVASLLILKDSVVVGKQWLDPEDTTLVDLAQGESQSFELLGSMTVCTPAGGDAPGLPLPPGDYKAMGVLEVMIKELQETGGEAQSMTVLYPAISGAVDITVR